MDTDEHPTVQLDHLIVISPASDTGDPIRISPATADGPLIVIRPPDPEEAA